MRQKSFNTMSGIIKKLRIFSAMSGMINKTKKFSCYK